MIMAECAAHPEACLYHSTFVAQCIVADVLDARLVHIGTAQLKLTPSTTDGSPQELSRTFLCRTGQQCLQNAAKDATTEGQIPPQLGLTIARVDSGHDHR